jgi:uncharacterized protein YwlG (UPF0340 family)
MPFEHADAKRAAEIESTMAKAILPFAHNTPILLAIVACCTLARKLIMKAHPAHRRQLEEVAAMFVSGDVPDEQKMILTPGGGPFNLN